MSLVDEIWIIEIPFILPTPGRTILVCGLETVIETLVWMKWTNPISGGFARF